MAQTDSTTFACGTCGHGVWGGSREAAKDALQEHYVLEHGVPEDSPVIRDGTKTRLEKRRDKLTTEPAPASPSPAPAPTTGAA